MSSDPKILPEDFFGATPKDTYRKSARDYARKYSLDEDIFEKQLNQESGFNPNAGSNKGAKGIGQFMPGTGARYGLKTPQDFADPHKSMDASARHMRDLLDANDNDYERALAAYNAGQGRVNDGSYKRIKETRNYIKSIRGFISDELKPKVDPDAFFSSAGQQVELEQPATGVAAQIQELRQANTPPAITPVDVPAKPIVPRKPTDRAGTAVAISDLIQTRGKGLNDDAFLKTVKDRAARSIGFSPEQIEQFITTVGTHPVDQIVEQGTDQKSTIDALIRQAQQNEGNLQLVLSPETVKYYEDAKNRLDPQGAMTREAGKGYQAALPQTSPLLKKSGEIASNVASGMLSVPASALRGLDVAAQAIGGEASEGGFRGLAESLENLQPEYLQEQAQETGQTSAGKLARAGGSALSFGLLGGPLGKAATGLLGASSNAGDVYDEARRMGASPEDAMKAAGFGAVVGTTEMFGVPGAVRRALTPGLKAGAKELAKAMLRESAEEGGQEALQGLLNNLVAKGYYDPNRPLTQDVLENAIIGATLGGGIGGGARVAGNVLESRAQEQAAATEADNALKAQVLASTLPPKGQVDVSGVQTNIPQPTSVGPIPSTGQATGEQSNVAGQEVEWNDLEPVEAAGAEPVTPAKPTREIEHARLGRLTVDPDQSGVPAKHVAGIDGKGQRHIVQNPNTIGNRDAAYVKRQVEVMAEPSAPPPSPPQPTETPASEAVREGQAKKGTYFHGTSEDFGGFTAIDQTKSVTGNPTAVWGTFFTDLPEEANRYVKDFHGGKGKVIEARINLKNPYQMSMAEFNSFTTPKDLSNPDWDAMRQRAAEEKQRLISEGYDGIVVGKGKYRETVAFRPDAIEVINETKSSLPARGDVGTGTSQPAPPASSIQRMGEAATGRKVPDILPQTRLASEEVKASPTQMRATTGQMRESVTSPLPAIQTGDDIYTALREKFGYDHKTALSTARVNEAVMQAAADTTGRDTGEFYRGLFAGFEAGKQVGKEALEQSSPPAPVFYSKLQRTIESSQQSRFAPQQLKGMLDKAGIKQEERIWTGIDDWLANHRGPVTKDEALEFLRANQVEVEEVTKGGGRSIAEIDAEMDSLHDQGDILTDPELNARHQALQTERNAVQSATKFSQYVLPSGENYRELLLTLPVRKNENPIVVFNEQTGKDVARFKSISEAQEMVRQNPNVLDWKDTSPETSASYRSSHFDEPNILAHIRFNERVDSEGKKVLFVEEIQSDWHQAGRKKGYKQPLTEETKAKIRTLEARRNRAGLTGGKQAAATYSQLTAEIDQLRGVNAVPDAPFKKDWPKLAMKRAIRYAAENGFDRVAWTTGAQQAERYDLSKQIEQISYRTNEDNAREVTIVAISGQHIEVTVNPDSGKVTNTNMAKLNGKPFDEVVGKELADKILSSRWGDLTGIDLRVGGEGMKGFYDRELPNIANDIGKKFGARVGKTEIGKSRAIAGEQESPDGRPVEVIENEGWGGGYTIQMEDADATWGVFSNRADAERQLAKLQANYKESPVFAHSLDITPAMRESVMRGQPLFQGAKGATEFLEDGRAIIHALNNPDASTGIHELGHVYRRFVYRMLDMALPKKKAEIQAMIDVMEAWTGEKGKDWSRPSEEKWSRAFERYMRSGKAPNSSLQEVFSHFKEWLSKIYASIKGSPIDVEVSPGIRSVFDRLLDADAKVVADTKAAVSQPTTPAPLKQQAFKPRNQEERDAQKSLSQFVKERGGLKADSETRGEIYGYLTSKEGGKVGLVNKNGQSVNNMRENANEAGYGPWDDDNEFLQAVTDDASGRKVYSGARNYEGEISDEEAAYLEAKDAEIAEEAFNRREIKAADYVNLDKLNVSTAEKEALSGLIEDRIRQTGAEKKVITFEDVRREAAELDPEIVKNLKPVKAGETLDPVVRYAARQRLNTLNSQAVNLRAKIEQGRLTLDSLDLEALEMEAATHEADARQLIDILWPTRSQDGRNLAYHRMMADASWDVEHWVSKARRVAESAGRDLNSAEYQAVEKGIRSVLANGDELQARIDGLEKYIKSLEAKNAELKKGQAQSPAQNRARRVKAAESYKDRLTEMEKDARARLTAAGVVPSSPRVLMQEAEKQARAPRFKEWFGDSKVVDSEGEPLTLYHGTAEDFEAFRIPKTRRGNAFDRDSNVGIFLTVHPVQADYFALIKGKAKSRAAFGDPVGSNVLPVYLKMENPLEVDYSDTPTFKDPDEVVKLAKQAKKEGKDGLILRNIYDAPVGKPTDLYIAFSPTQVKSVFNRGTFSSTDPRILFQADPIEGVADYAIIGASKLARKGMSLDTWMKEMRDEWNLDPKDAREVYKRSFSLYRQEQRAALRASRINTVTGGKVQDFDTATIEQLLTEKAELLKEQQKARRELARLFTSLEKRNPVKTALLDLWNLPRSLKSSFDLSAPLRQGLILTTSHPIKGAKAAAEMFKAVTPFYGAKSYDSLKASLSNAPNARLAKTVNLYLSTREQDVAPGSLNAREEAFMSKFASFLPHVKLAERAYVAYLDKLRMDVFDGYVAELKKAGLDPVKNKDEFVNAARFVNITSGRGEISTKYNGIMPFLNGALFSPKYTYSRIQALNPATYAKMTPAARKIALRDMSKFLGVVGATLFMSALSGASVGLDPDDSDFLKIKFGDTRYDILAGLQQFFVAGVRIAQSAYYGASGKEQPYGKDAISVTKNLVRSKLAPTPGFIWNLLEGKDFKGEKFDAKKGALDLVTPMSGAEMFESYKREGGKGVAKNIPGIFGVGVNTYQKKGSLADKARNRQRPQATR